MADTVVHYVDSAVFGGSEQVILLLLSRIDRHRWNPVLYVHDEPGIARLVSGARELGVVCRFVASPKRLSDLPAWWSLTRQLRHDRPTVFHVHLNWPLGCRHAVLAARLARLPYTVATAHLYGPLTGVRWSWLKQKMHAAAIHRYIAVSSEVERRLRDDLGVSQARLCVVHNGIETAPDRPPGDPSLKDSLRRGSDLPIVLTVARLHEQKGHDHLLAAATLVRDAIFVLAGDGPERDRLQDRARQLGIADRVRFLGQRRDVAALLDACDLFVLPSLYEGLPLSVLEAMAAGRPVVATSVGGTEEVLIDGVNGRLVPPGDARSLASAISAMLSDPAEASRLAAEGQARVNACFSVEAMARGVEEVYTHDLARLHAGEQRQFA